jgi:hypothetical protein
VQLRWLRLLLVQQLWLQLLVHPTWPHQQLLEQGQVHHLLLCCCCCCCCRLMQQVHLPFLPLLALEYQLVYQLCLWCLVHPTLILQQLLEQGQAHHRQTRPLLLLELLLLLLLLQQVLARGLLLLRPYLLLLQVCFLVR